MKRAFAAFVLAAVVLVPTVASSATSEPNVGTIAFVRVGDDGLLHIYSIQPDGSGFRQLTHANADDSQPAWSPDGGQIAFTRDTVSALPRVWVMNADGSGAHDLMPGKTGQSPAWAASWFGPQIAFQRRGHIWTMLADGTQQTQLPSPRGCSDSSPAASPRLIAFVRGCKSDDATSGIFTMGWNGADQSVAFPDFRGDVSYFDPSWSPGRLQLAYTDDEAGENGGAEGIGHGNTFANYDFTRQIDGLNCIVDYHGYGNLICDVRDPAWDPTGTSVIYEVDRKERRRLYILDAAGNAPPALLTRGFEAAWFAPPFHPSYA